MSFEVVDSNGEVCRRYKCSECDNHEDFRDDDVEMENHHENYDDAIQSYLFGEGWNTYNLGLYIYCDVCCLNKRNHKLYGKYHPYDNKYVTDEDDDEAIAKFLLEGECRLRGTRVAFMKLIKTWRKALKKCKPYRTFEKYKKYVKDAEDKRWDLTKYVDRVKERETMYVFLIYMKKRAAGSAEVQKKRKRDDTSPFVSSQLAQRCYENTNVCRAIMKFL
jgi:hypothetical protein